MCSPRLPLARPVGWGADKAGRRKRLYDAPRTPPGWLLDTDALTKAQKTDLISYRNQLNPAAITRRIIELQDVLIRLAKDKTDQLYLAQFPSILPDVHKTYDSGKPLDHYRATRAFLHEVPKTLRGHRDTRHPAEWFSSLFLPHRRPKQPAPPAGDHVWG